MKSKIGLVVLSLKNQIWASSMSDQEVWQTTRRIMKIF
jgi:hypothetical protein